MRMMEFRALDALVLADEPDVAVQKEARVRAAQRPRFSFRYSPARMAAG